MSLFMFEMVMRNETNKPDIETKYYFRKVKQDRNNEFTRKSTSFTFSISAQCVICDAFFTQPKKATLSVSKICPECLKKPEKVATSLSLKMMKWDKTFDQLSRICGSCARAAGDSCKSFDCPVIYQRVLAEAEANQVPVVRQLLAETFFDF